MQGVYLEGLTKRWYRTTYLKGRWHYYDGNGSHSACTLVFSDKQKEYLEKFEIQEGILCNACVVLADSEKILIHAETISQMGKTLLNRICSEEGCNITGVAYVSQDTPLEKPHYCTKHNLRVQNNLK